jgi:hypothetical protein
MSTVLDFLFNKLSKVHKHKVTLSDFNRQNHISKYQKRIAEVQIKIIELDPELKNIDYSTYYNLLKAKLNSHWGK